MGGCGEIARHGVFFEIAGTARRVPD
ncbi:hypothetical protein FP2506_18424 [Fulvimarina pelagi HTCC2506]|uniref:Uncharacterized protein n=1 Tax=Fulvimarina pelagi HTCC2506 TaxID=314231 RepID=Q0G0U8_9HYPH|nr:hypothetical protein FP2506_18424 [Fulvimarina pelagi HTCC2506]